MSEQKPKDGESRFTGFEAIPLRIAVRAGEARFRLGRLVELKPGDLVPLGRSVGEPFELLSGGRLLGTVEPVAEGEGIAVKLVEVPEDDDGPNGG